MADSASPRACRWCEIDRGSLAVIGIAHIVLDRRFVAPLDGNPAVRLRQRTIPDNEMAPPSPGWQRIGRFEQVVADSHQLSPMRSRILGVLLGSGKHPCSGGNATLRPMWTNETMYHAYQTVRLTRLLDDRIPCRDRDTAETDIEWRIANGLAEALYSLRIAHDSEKLHCSGVLRNVVWDLVELFGGAMGIPDVSTSIEPMELASFKRHALVLVAGYLVIQLLFCAFRERCSGQILVALDRPSHRLGRLVVGYDHRVAPLGPLDGDQGVVNDLASLLESDVSYRAAGGRIGVGVEFPLR
jgi:hypothetical protein